MGEVRVSFFSYDTPLKMFISTGPLEGGAVDATQLCILSFLVDAGGGAGGELYCDHPHTEPLTPGKALYPGARNTSPRADDGRP